MEKNVQLEKYIQFLMGWVETMLKLDSSALLLQNSLSMFSLWRSWNYIDMLWKPTNIKQDK